MSVLAQMTIGDGLAVLGGAGAVWAIAWAYVRHQQAQTDLLKNRRDLTLVSPFEEFTETVTETTEGRGTLTLKRRRLSSTSCPVRSD